MKKLAIWVPVLWTVGSYGCRTKPVVTMAKIPPPPTRHEVVVDPSILPDPPSTLLDSPRVEIYDIVAVETGSVRLPPPPTPVVRRRVRVFQGPQPFVRPATSEPATTAIPPLEEALSEQEQRQYIHDLEQDVLRAKSVLRTAREHRLNATQVSIMKQIESFLRQAQELRATDLPGARSLTGKARALADELAANFGR